MNSPHPFTWLPPERHKAAFILFLILALTVMAVMQLLGAPLVTAVAPGGIVSFELAGSLSSAQAMIASWDGRAQIYAGLGLGFDYLFMLAYAGAIGLGCVLVARRLATRLGHALAWGVLLAALLDVVENIALIQLLLGQTAVFWPVLARWCAIPKFALVAAGLLYVLGGAVINLIRPAKPTPRR